MPRSASLYTTLSLAVAMQTAGCADASPEWAVEVRDSSGVTIVTNGPVKQLPEVFRISPTPLLDLGGNRGFPEQELAPEGPFHNAARMSDGRYVAVSNHDLKVYGPEGQYIRTIGRQGEGPGEFGQVRSVCIAAGDTIVAIHYSRPSISVFDSMGEHVRTLIASEGYVDGSGCFSDGSVLILADFRARGDTELPPEHARILDRIMTVRRMATDGADLGSLGEFPAGTLDLNFQTMANVIPHSGELYVGDGRKPEFQVHASDGTLRAIVRWTETLVPVTADLIDERIRASIPSNTPRSEIQQRLDYGRSRPHPSHVPVYFHIMVDAADRVWVQDHPVGSDRPWPWTVFDAEGRALGRVYIPPVAGAAQMTVDIRSISRDTVILSWRDEELGFPHLSFHVLETGPW